MNTFCKKSFILQILIKNIMASTGKAISGDLKQQIRASALNFLAFLNKSVTPFHGMLKFLI